MLIEKEHSAHAQKDRIWQDSASLTLTKRNAGFGTSYFLSYCLLISVKHNIRRREMFYHCSKLYCISSVSFLILQKKTKYLHCIINISNKYSSLSLHVAFNLWEDKFLSSKLNHMIAIFKHKKTQLSKTCPVPATHRTIAICESF